MAGMAGMPSESALDILSALSDTGPEEVQDDKVIPEDKKEKKDDTEFQLQDDEDTDDSEDESDEKESDEDDEEDDEKKDLNLDDDDLALDIPNRQKILKDFPELFKKYPSVEKAIYREQQFAEVFSHPKDAIAAKENLQILDHITNDLENGNIGRILASTKKQDEKAFEKIADNILDTIKDIDQPAYWKTVNGVFQSALAGIAERYKGAAKGSDEEQNLIAVRLIHKLIYGSLDVKAPEAKKVAEVDPREEALSNKEKAFEKTALDRAVVDVDDRITNVLTKSIKEAIDPKTLMSDYVKDRAVEDVMNEFKKELNSDKRFNNLLNRYWMDAKINNYSEESKSKIRELIKRQAKQSLPDIIKRVRGVALKGLDTRRSPRRDEAPLARRRPAPANTSHKGVSESKTKHGVPRVNVSAEEFLAGD